MKPRGLLQKLRAWTPFIPMWMALQLANWRSRRPPLLRQPSPWGTGVSVLIPESGTPDLLDATLAHAAAAIAMVQEPVEIIVQVNGAPRELYAELEQRYPAVHWRFVPAALGFNGAIEAGLHAVRYPAVYLLNSDMRIAPDALQQLLPYRAPTVFALASQIFFADAARRREETGWSGYYVKGARTVVYEKDPGAMQVARGSFYAGGGSSLFRCNLLREYVRASRGYSPFYWEDADWGARAWEEGLECIFVPQSKAVHEHRGTIKRRYSADEIDRIMDRNALLFELRHHFTDMDGIRAIGHLAGQPAKTRKELASLAIAGSVASIRGRSNACKRSGFDCTAVIHNYYSPPRQDGRPTVLWVTPFSVYPPSHGGARRVAELAARVGRHVNLLLLSDEGASYKDTDHLQFTPFQSVHILQARKDKSDQREQDLLTRMQVHAPDGLKSELRRLQQQYAVDLVQIEFMEATTLVDSRLGTTPFVASLHDVYLDGGEQDAAQLKVLRRYDTVVACSDEDARWVQDLPTKVVGNGAVDRYAHSLPSPPKKQILFMGPFRYQPNFSGLLEFLTRVWPALLVRHPGVELVVLGGPESAAPRFDHAALRQTGVQVVSEFVDPAPLLAACALTINPQQEIRGSALKVAEALLARRICVSTTAGARGFDQLGASALRICDSWPAMLEELDMLLGNIDHRHDLEQSSDSLRSALSWDGKAEQLLALYRKLLPQCFNQENRR